MLLPLPSPLCNPKQDKREKLWFRGIWGKRKPFLECLSPLLIGIGTNQVIDMLSPHRTKPLGHVIQILEKNVEYLMVAMVNCVQSEVGGRKKEGKKGRG